MVGVACTLIAVVLVPPVPFANLAPALAMGALSIGLTRKDGVFVLAGYGLILVALGSSPWVSRLFPGIHSAATMILRPGG